MIGERADRRFPIMTQEIARYRKNLRIGERVRAEFRKTDPELRVKKVEADCTIVKKYPHVCIVKDRHGRQECVQYVELFITERNRDLHENGGGHTDAEEEKVKGGKARE